MTTKTAELRKALRAAEAEEAAAKQALREATPIRKAYVITPQAPRDTWQPLFDPACRFYRISCRVTNREEAEAVGHHLGYADGGMTYLFNTATGKLAASCGGGLVMISGDDAQELADALSAFLVANPGGGDVTAIYAARKA